MDRSCIFFFEKWQFSWLISGHVKIPEQADRHPLEHGRWWSRRVPPAIVRDWPEYAAGEKWNQEKSVRDFWTEFFGILRKNSIFKKNFFDKNGGPFNLPRMEMKRINTASWGNAEISKPFAAGQSPYPPQSPCRDAWRYGIPPRHAQSLRSTNGKRQVLAKGRNLRPCTLVDTKASGLAGPPLRTPCCGCNVGRSHLTDLLTSFRHWRVYFMTSFTTPAHSPITTKIVLETGN